MRGGYLTLQDDTIDPSLSDGCFFFLFLENDGLESHPAVADVGLTNSNVPVRLSSSSEELAVRH